MCNHEVVYGDGYCEYCLLCGELLGYLDDVKGGFVDLEKEKEKEGDLKDKESKR